MTQKKIFSGHCVKQLIVCLMAWPLIMSLARAHANVISYNIVQKSDAFNVQVCNKTQQALLFDWYNADRTYFKIRQRRSVLNLPVDDCLHYRFLFKKAARGKQNSLIRAAGETYISRGERWLLGPRDGPMSSIIHLHFTMMTGQMLSTPWPTTTVDSTYHFETPLKNFDWPYVIAFGTLNRFSIQLEEQWFDIAFSDDLGKANSVRLLPWLKRSFNSIKSLYQRFPVAFTQVVVSRSQSGNEPVPFAQVLRGGEASLHFYIRPEYPLYAFVEDWTSYHESAHLLLPFIQRKDAWVSEGLASYFQYLVMARSGVISEETFWRKLYKGFLRGERSYQRSRGQSLLQVTPHMFSKGAVRRVYWSGAIAFLQADLQLRQQQPPSSLVVALERFNRRYMPSHRSWSAGELATALDAVTQSSVFSDIFNHTAGLKTYPDFRSLLRKLGIHEADGQLHFQKEPSKVSLRHGIVTNGHQTKAKSVPLPQNSKP